MLQEELVMAIDVGTTSLKCTIVSKSGEVKVSASNGYPLTHRNSGWVEQNPEDWWHSLLKSIEKCLKVVDCNSIRAVSLSGQMSAPVFMGENETILYPSILISDIRSKRQSEYLQDNYLQDFIRNTGNQPVDAFTVSKLLWMKEEEPELLSKTKKFVFPKDFIRYKLTGKLGTDPTDAGNSLLYDTTRNDWNWELIKKVKLDPDIFPDVYKSVSKFGIVSSKSAAETGLAEGTQVITGAADMACSQLGSGAIDDSTVAITLSTSGQVVMNIHSFAEQGIGKVTFHNGAKEGMQYSMGTLFTGGLGVEWGYKLLFNKESMEEEDYHKLNKLTKEMENYQPGSDGLLFLPFLVGSATPYFDPKDRASWVGLGLHQEKSLMLHSILEGISFNILENVRVIQDMGKEIKKIHIGAGGSRNQIWCQMIADLLGINLVPLKNRDSSALGAAIIAGTGAGIYQTVEEGVKITVKGEKEIQYNEHNFNIYQSLFEGYQYVYKSINRYYSTYL